MNPFTEPITVSHYLIAGAVLFVTGAVCMATKRNALGVLMGIELVLNGANLNFVAFGSKFLRDDSEHSPSMPVFGDNVVPQNACAAAVGMGEPGKDRYQRRLAGAVGSQ